VAASSRTVTGPIRSIVPVTMGGSDLYVTTTGAVNSAPATSGTTSLPIRASVRHDDRWFAFTPCRRATSFTMTAGTSVSATIRPFAASDHRRFAAVAASNSTNPTASKLRSRWTPTHTSRVNLDGSAIAAYRFSRKVGSRQRLPFIDLDLRYVPYALDGRILATASRTIQHFRPWTSLARAAINGPK